MLRVFLETVSPSDPLNSPSFVRGDYHVTSDLFPRSLALFCVLQTHSSVPKWQGKQSHLNPVSWLAYRKKPFSEPVLFFLNKRGERSRCLPPGRQAPLGPPTPGFGWKPAALAHCPPSNTRTDCCSCVFLFFLLLFFFFLIRSCGVILTSRYPWRTWLSIPQLCLQISAPTQRYLFASSQWWQVDMNASTSTGAQDWPKGLSGCSRTCVPSVYSSFLPSSLSILSLPHALCLSIHVPAPSSASFPYPHFTGSLSILLPLPFSPSPAIHWSIFFVSFSPNHLIQADPVGDCVRVSVIK